MSDGTGLECIANVLESFAAGQMLGDSGPLDLTEEGHICKVLSSVRTFRRTVTVPGIYTSKRRRSKMETEYDKPEA